MLSFEPNIVFIDDKINQVDGIINLYRNEGIGVKYYNADIADGDTPPQNPFSNVNLIYLDLYYKEDFDLDLCLGWIDSIVPKNSFYVLVLWSKDPHHKDEIIEGLSKINQIPFITFCETKNDDYKNPDSSFKWTELKAKIDSEINKISELEELAVWKKSVQNASNIIVGTLSKNSSQEQLKTKLQKIIIGHGGSSLSVKDNIPFKRETLFDALDSVLVSNTKGSIPTTDISETNIQNLYNIPDNIQGDIDSKLNSWFHFKLHKEPLDQEIIKPGIICNYKDADLQNLYALLKDENIENYLKHQITKSKEENSTTELIDIVLLISRPCDIAQNKFGRNLKLVSGILVKNPVRKNGKGKPLHSGTKYDSIKLYDHISFSDKDNDTALIFDFRYVFSIPKESFIENFENIKVFNKELLSEIQVEYSSYSSRLGITQII
jgi:hypothetical protein